MEIFESIGFINFWGFSPRIDLIEDKDKEDQSKNIFLIGGSEIGHILKTTADNMDQQVNYYVFEKQKESFVRQLLLLLVVNCKNLNQREKCELYLDIYGNSLIREKSQEFIEESIGQLIKLVTDYDRSELGIKQMLDLTHLKYKDIDEIVNILQSYSGKVDFKMEDIRDKRLRRHYKERYDYRVNLIDWDYQMEFNQENQNVKDTSNSKVIHFQHYKDFRQTGIAFEHRFSKYTLPNRTLASYMYGKHKNHQDKHKNNTSCMVRGFWGDIVNTPYLAYGIHTDYAPEKDWMFKTVNMQMATTAMDVTHFNIMYWLTFISSKNQYRSPIDNPYIQQQQSQQQQQQQQPKNLQSIPEEEETQQITQQDNISNSNIQTKFIYDFNSILQGFQKIKIIPIFEEIEKISNKKKFEQFFDICFVGFMNSNLIKNEGLKKVMKKDSTLYFENTRFFVGLSKEKKKELNDQIINLGKESQYLYIDSQKEYLAKFKNQ